MKINKIAVRQAIANVMRGYQVGRVFSAFDLTWEIRCVFGVWATEETVGRTLRAMNEGIKEGVLNKYDLLNGWAFRYSSLGKGKKVLIAKIKIDTNDEGK